MTTGEVQYYAVKAMFPAESIEIADRIEWCKDNEVKFSNVSIMGCFLNGRHYTSEEMQETGVLTYSDTDGNEVAEINLSTLPPINIGIGFVFFNETDAIAFKLRWI